jgi:cyclase
MKKKRVIPILILKDNWLVQSKGFTEYKKIGDPVIGVKRFSDWDADELIYLNITQTEYFSESRKDTKNFIFNSANEALNEISKFTNMPITVGGGLKTLHEIESRLINGADKVALNSAALYRPSLISEAAREFGRQSLVISVDYKFDNHIPRVWNRLFKSSDLPYLTDWTRKVEDLGAGEILLNSVDRDGMKTGYDIETINLVCESANIPIIACGGAGDWIDMEEVMVKTNADAVAAANIFHFQDQSIYLARDFLFSRNLPVRPATLASAR